jgi:tetratricopeptide (TPR) repeat protein
MKKLIAFFLCLLPAWVLGQNCCKPNNIGGLDLPPEVFEGIGHIDVNCTTDNDSCKFFIEQGWALVHQYNFSAAGRSFNKAIQLDSSCMMAYIGYHNILYIEDEDDLAYDIYSLVYDKWGDYINLSRDVQDSIFKLDTVYNEDEYGLFHVLMHSNYVKRKEHYLVLYGGLDFLNLRGNNGLILSQIIPQNESEENNPLIDYYGSKMFILLNEGRIDSKPFYQHYIIHALEDTTPQDLLQYARTLPQLAPSSAHLVHMPAHVYYKLGIYDSALYWVNESIKVDTSYNKKYPKYAIYNWNYNHNLDYKSRVLMEMGYPDSARQPLKKFILDPNCEDFEFQQMVSKTSELIVSWRYRDWKKLEEEAKAMVGVYETEGYNLWFRTLQQYARMMDLIEHNDFENWKAEEKHWKSLKKAAKKDKDYNYWDLFYWMRTEINAMYAARNQDEIDADFYTYQMKDWSEIADLEYGDPSDLPANIYEHIGHVYYQGQFWQKAVNYFEYALKKQPNAGFIELYLAKSYFHLGNKTQAQICLDRFYSHWQPHESNKKQFEMARILSAELKK